jgi:hypothetical protein
MSCIKVCPNVCECGAIIWKKNVHTIMGESTCVSFRCLINVSIASYNSPNHIEHNYHN